MDSPFTSHSTDPVLGSDEREQEKTNDVPLSIWEAAGELTTMD